MTAASNLWAGSERTDGHERQRNWHSKDLGQDQPDTQARPQPAWHAPGRECPAGPLGTLTLLAALRCDRIDAPCVIDEEVLVPSLRPGDVIIDNLGSHEGKAVRQAMRAAGAKLFFLPPYSPDLNPKVFAKLKTLLRKAAERSVEATWKRIGALLQCFTPAECATISETRICFRLRQTCSSATRRVSNPYSITSWARALQVSGESEAARLSAGWRVERARNFGKRSLLRLADCDSTEP